MYLRARVPDRYKIDGDITERQRCCLFPLLTSVSADAIPRGCGGCRKIMREPIMVFIFGEDSDASTAEHLPSPPPFCWRYHLVDLCCDVVGVSVTLFAWTVDPREILLRE